MLGTDRVVPVVIFLRDAARAPTTLALGTERRAYLTFEYIPCKLAEMPAERWLDSGNLVARVNLVNMRFDPARRVETYAAAVRGLFELEPDRQRREKYLDFIDMYAGLNDNERRRYREQYPQEATTMAGIVQRARDEGKQRGADVAAAAAAAAVRPPAARSRRTHRPGVDARPRVLGRERARRRHARRGVRHEPLARLRLRPGMRRGATVARPQSASMDSGNLMARIDPELRSDPARRSRDVRCGGARRGLGQAPPLRRIAQTGEVPRLHRPVRRSRRQ